MQPDHSRAVAITRASARERAKLSADSRCGSAVSAPAGTPAFSARVASSAQPASAASTAGVSAARAGRAAVSAGRWYPRTAAAAGSVRP